MRIITLIAICIFASGCSVIKVEKMDRQIKLERQEIEDIIDGARKQHHQKPKSTQVRIADGEGWTYKEFSANTSNLGLRETVRALSQGYPVTFDIPKDYNPKVSSSRDSKTIRDHFESIEMQADVGIVVARGGVIVQKTKTQMFEIPVFGSDTEQYQGYMRYSMGADNLNRVEGSDAEEFINQVFTLVNPYKEIKELVQSSIPTSVPCADVTITYEDAKENEILDCFTLSSIGNTLTITAKPRQLARFKPLYSEWFAKATREANVSIRVLEIDVTDIAQQQFDVNLVRNSLLQTSFNNNNDDLIDIVDTGGGSLTFEFLDPSLYIAGTQGVIRALNKISNVSLIEEHSIELHNNRLKTIREFGTVRYVKQATIQNTNQGNTSISTPSVELDEIRTGNALNILSTITQDEINMHIVINRVDVTGFDTFNFGDGQLTGRFPQDQGKDEVFDVSLRDRQIVLMSSSSRELKTVDRGANDFAPIIGDSRRGELRVMQRVYLISGSINQR